MPYGEIALELQPPPPPRVREVKLLCVWLFLSFSPWRALPNLAKKAKRARERWTESEGRGREKESERERERWRERWREKGGIDCYD